MTKKNVINQYSDDHKQNETLFTCRRFQITFKISNLSFFSDHLIK